MDLIYTNANLVDQGVFLDYELDLAFGADENNFECRIPANSHCCEAGSLLYMEGTEYGGIVDSIESDSENDEVVYRGRTWHGILGSKVILPLQEGETISEEAQTIITQNGTVLNIVSGIAVQQAGNALFLSSVASIKYTDSDGSLVDKHLVLSGDANACLAFLLSRIGLSGLFSASESGAGANIRQYAFDRYTDAYTGIVKMLDSAGMKLHASFRDGVVTLSAEQKHDYTQDAEFNSDLVQFKIVKKYKTVNHLICLGSGELENRTVIHLYADKSGNISQEQTQSGLDEYVDVLDYSNAESEEELIKSGKENLKSLWSTDELSIDFDADDDIYDVGDIVGAIDHVTGITVSATITKKIVTIQNGQTTISYKVGE